MAEKNFGGLGEIRFADGIQTIHPVLLFLDTSQSMEGEKIEALNRGVRAFAETIKSETLARKSVEVAVITFDSRATLVQDFVLVREFDPPVFTAQGSTAMGAAILLGLDIAQTRKMFYRERGIPYSRPVGVLITDGEPYGEPAGIMEEAMRLLREAETRKRFTFFPIAVQGANMARLKDIFTQEPILLTGLEFEKMFRSLSVSLEEVASEGEDFKLTAEGWGTKQE